MTKTQLLERLRTLDETTLLDLLELTSDDIVDMFPEQIEEKFLWLEKQLSD